MAIYSCAQVQTLFILIRLGMTENAYSAMIMDYNDLVLSLEYASRSVIFHAVDLIMSAICHVHMQKASRVDPEHRVQLLAIGNG